jgi:hypothetical protein
MVKRPYTISQILSRLRMAMNNLSYESRNEPCFARRWGMFYPLKLDGQIEKLRKRTKRWTYRGRPTKNARKLLALEQMMQQGLSVSDCF